MKVNLFLVLLFSFLFNQILLSADTQLEKYSRITLKPSDSTISFDSSSFATDSEIYFKITATQFIDSLNYITCAFGSGGSDFQVDFTNTIKKNNRFVKYFKVIKNSANLGSSTGEFLTITFYCTGEDDVIIENTKEDESSNLAIDYQVDLKKYGKVTVKGEDEYIIFDSSDFKEGEEMFFIISCTRFIYNEIDFEFFDDPSLNTEYKHGPTNFVDKTIYSNNANNVTNYYTIKKNKDYLGTFKGKYMTLYFYCIGTVEIENTKEDEGLALAVVIIIIVLAVALVGFLVWLLCYCLRKRAIQKLGQQNGNLQNAQVESQQNVRVGEHPNPRNPNQPNQNQYPPNQYNPNQPNQNQYPPNNNQYNPIPYNRNQYPQ